MHTFGTRVTGGLDTHKLGKAISRPGMDTRCWSSEGTVGTLDPETGDLDFTDRHAIYNDSGGTHVDVELQPLGWHVPVRYAPAQAGEATICGPIRPGDIVLVEFPGGGTDGGVITKIINSRSQRQPVENGRPIFDNNRLLIHTRTVPIDVRAGKDARVLLEQDGSATVTAKKAVVASGDVRLGDAGATEQAVLGTTQATKLATLLADIAAAFTENDGLWGGTAPASVAAAAQCTAFIAKIQTMLSNVVKVAP